MKTMMGILSFFWIASAAAGLSSIPTDNMISFLKKTGACRVAFADVENGSVVNPVYCVWDGVGNPGTIREIKGCFLGRFDSEVSDPNHRYSPLLNHGAGLQGRSQPDGPCSTDLILKMLTAYPLSDYLSIGRTKEPVLVHFRKQDKNIRVFYDPDGVITPAVLASIDSWRPSSKKVAKGRPKIPAPENNPVCQTFTVTQEDKWKCASREDLESEGCALEDLKAKLGDQYGDKERSISEIAEIYEARFGHPTPKQCDQEKIEAFRKKSGQ